MSKCDGCMKHRDCIKTANYRLIAQCTEYATCNDCVWLDGIDYPDGACYFCVKEENLENRSNDGYCPHFTPEGKAQ